MKRFSRVTSIYLAILLFVFSPVSQSGVEKDDYTLFEVDPVRPVAVLNKSGFVAAVNVPDDYLEIFRPTPHGAKHCASIKVGMRPVAVAAVRQSRHRAQLWVVNQLSDSISVVRINTRRCAGEVIDTIPVADEPRDIVVAHTPKGKRVLITAAHRGRHHPDPVVANAIEDLKYPAQEKIAKGRPAGLADVLIFNANDWEQTPQVVNLFSDKPRALALGPKDSNGFHTSVYAAGFHTGNKTSVLAHETVRAVGVDHIAELIAHGEIVENSNGELVPLHSGEIKMKGGMRAVKGNGRCIPDPRPDRIRRHMQQMCVHTDTEHNILGFRPQLEGVVDGQCACTSADGALQTMAGHIVKFFSTPELCGDAYNPFLGGCWLDRDPADIAENPSLALPMEWNDWVKFSLPDEDVFHLSLADPENVEVIDSYKEVGTVLFDLASHPENGTLYVANQDANNLTRFEGFGNFADSSVRADIVKSRISIIDNAQVKALNVNDHIDPYSNTGEKRSSLAFPVDIEISKKRGESGELDENQTLYFAALGSDKIAYVSTDVLEQAEENNVNEQLQSVRLTRVEEDGTATIAGPVGMALDDRRERLYVYTRFTNELLVLDTSNSAPEILERLGMHSPEPEDIAAGRHVLYYAPEMSANGDQACASCHVFGEADSLAWDLGDPDGATVNNPGPFVSPPQLGYVSDLAVDPEEQSPFRKVLSEDLPSNKGPMTTQPLRGLANHGPLHWRGDRIRNRQTERGEQPDLGTLDERESFLEFDEAVTKLTGSEELLPAEKMQALTDFVMQVSYPPNPIRQLDNGLSELEMAGRAAYFGCVSMTDEQFEQRQCIGTNGELVDVDFATRECECFGNPIRFMLHRLTSVQALAREVANLQVSLDSSIDPDGSISQNLQAYLDELAPLSQEVANLSRVPLAGLASSGNIVSLTAEAMVYKQDQLDSIQAFLVGSEYPNHPGGLLAFITATQAHEAQTGENILGSILASMNLNDVAAELMPGYSDPSLIAATLLERYGDANVSRKPLLDALEPAGFEQDTLQGCRVEITAQYCPLRIADSLTTCQGCHTLDPSANAEFGVASPGLFGTNAEYSFSNVPFILKVPHLRNSYQKVGRFGQPHDPDMFIDQSVFGPRAGGFLSRKNPHVGPAVRGFGVAHDGSSDTFHRFAGLIDFFRRPPLALGPNDVRGNPDALDAFTPKDPQACLASVVNGKDAFLGALGVSPDTLISPTLAALNGDEAAAQSVVGAVLTSPAPQMDGRWAAIASSAISALQQGQAVSKRMAQPIVEAVASALFCPDVPDPNLMPLCFQLGSSLEFGAADGVCYPTGLAEREAVEAFVLAFDTNLKPMVGQQLTLAAGSAITPELERMIKTATQGHCDIGIVSGKRGYLMDQPNAQAPESSGLLGDRYQHISLGRLLSKTKKPSTFTCYPPKENQAEARRSSIDRDGDNKLNGFDKVSTKDDEERRFEKLFRFLESLRSLWQSKGYQS